jgi:hypothetical protein
MMGIEILKPRTLVVMSILETSIISEITSIYQHTVPEITEHLPCWYSGIKSVTRCTRESKIVMGG